MKIASWNVNSLRVRLPQVLDWVGSSKPDILGVQETKMSDADFPAEEIQQAGYHVIFSGQKTYNGVALLSRHSSTEVVTDLPGFEDKQRRVLAATYRGIRVVNVYVPNGQSVGSEKYHYKLGWLEALQDFLRDELARRDQLLVMGDFNIAPQDRDVYDPAAWEGQVLCSAPEREALHNIMSLGFSDAFRLFDQPADSYSWWDYRAGAFRRNRGVRIDLILVNQSLKEQCVTCSIDKEPRKWYRPSDHTPVLAGFEQSLIDSP